MKEHDLTITEPDLKTEIQTSVISYMYKCPVCEEERRYAVPEDKQEVFCNGLDFGTKVKLKDYILEVAEAIYLKENFAEVAEAATDADKLYVTENLGDLQIIAPAKDGYALTEKGRTILMELKR